MPVPLLQFFRIQNSSHTVRTERQWHQSHRLRERKGDEGSFALQFRGEFSAFVGFVVVCQSRRFCPILNRHPQVSSLSPRDRTQRILSSCISRQTLEHVAELFDIRT
jgi:hypothetical protein